MLPLWVRVRVSDSVKARVSAAALKIEFRILITAIVH